MSSLFSFANAAASNRVSSEDRAHVFEHGESIIVVVADGAGGMRGGATASDAFVSAVRSRLAQADFDVWDLRAWSQVFKETDEALAMRLAGETTAIIVVLGHQGVLGVSVGDSEACVVSAQQIDWLTDKQTRKRLGSGLSSAVPFHRGSLDGTLIVGTDGLFKYVDGSSIAASCTVDGVAHIAERLIHLPKLPSGGYVDDVAVVVVARG